MRAARKRLDDREDEKISEDFALDMSIVALGDPAVEVALTQALDTGEWSPFYRALNKETFYRWGPSIDFDARWRNPKAAMPHTRGPERLRGTDFGLAYLLQNQRLEDKEVVFEPTWTGKFVDAALEVVGLEAAGFVVNDGQPNYKLSAFREARDH